MEIGSVRPFVVLGFDVDSVVGDLSSVLERVAWEVYGIRVSRVQFTEFRLEQCLPYEAEFVTRWINMALEPQWTQVMEPYPGAVKVLTKLSKFQPLRFVTARPGTEPVRTWLLRHLSEVPCQRIQVEAVGNSGSKVEVLKRWGVTHFIDDHLETCAELHENGIVPIVFEQPWNVGRHSFVSVKDWGEIRLWMQRHQATVRSSHA